MRRGISRVSVNTIGDSAMAKKRIIAHFMQESEREAARSKMSDVAETESYLLGEIDERDLPTLQQHGVIVQFLEDRPEETPGAEAEPAPGVRRRGLGPFAARPPAPRVDTTEPNFYLIRLKGPLLEQWRQQLTDQGVQLLDYVPRYAYTARLTPDQVSTVRTLRFVAAVRVYEPDDTGPIVARAKAPAPPAAAKAIITYDVRLHRAEDLAQVVNWLQSRGVNIAGAKGRKIRLYLLEDSPLTAEIAALPEVAAIEEYIPPKLHNDVARELLGVDPPRGVNPAIVLPQTGEDQIVAVADTGLDTTHPDFRGRIVGVVALGRPNDFSDPDGHGTHVAGSVLGDGSGSGGAIHGVAPRAKLFFQSLLDADGDLGGLPLDLGDLFEEAYQAGARIHNNSWGASTRSMYTINSVEVDEFVGTHRDMLIVISAGNEGRAADSLHTQPGFVDWLSIGSPASSKNALTVGASRSSRPVGGYAELTCGVAWPDEFPDPPISDERVSGNPEGLAAFSSRGPCDDRRIKPDVVAPGTDIVSTKSSRAPLRNFWGPYPGSPRYAYMGGTSMAAPLAAGCAALVREYYVKTRGHDPSAALIKATLINSTRWLTGADAVADHSAMPNYHQGFGRIDMRQAIPNPAVPELRLEFVDTWKEPARQFTRSGQRLRFRCTVGGGPSLRICLTWIDLPARALQNNLNVFIQHLPTGQKWIGNEGLPMALKIPDPDNNVEIMRLQNPASGDYLIQVSATNLLRGPQDFALVITGDVSGLTQV